MERLKKTRRRNKRIVSYNIEKEAEFLNNGRINYAVFKIAVVLFLAIFSWQSISGFKETLSYMSDEEESAGNYYNAGDLDFYLYSENNFIPAQIGPNDESARDIEIINSGSLSFQYGIKSLKTGGYDALCNALLIKAVFGLETKYSGNLEGLNTEPILISDTGEDDWSFIVTMPENPSPDLQDKVCNFELIFSGWQEDFNSDSSGFSDIEEIENTVLSGNWEPNVTVLYPNGGEVWYIVPPAWVRPGLGQYDITWTASSPLFDPLQLAVNIWFCKNSGADCFYKITDTPTENDGSYTWAIPYDNSFITHEARIKIEVEDPDVNKGEDMSDQDFCPPLLTEFEMTQLFGMLYQEESGFLPEIGIEPELPESIVEVVTPAEETVMEVFEEPVIIEEEPSVIEEEPVVAEEELVETESIETEQNLEEPEISDNNEDQIIQEDVQENQENI